MIYGVIMKLMKIILKIFILELLILQRLGDTKDVLDNNLIIIFLLLWKNVKQINLLLKKNCVIYVYILEKKILLMIKKKKK